MSTCNVGNIDAGKADDQADFGGDGDMFMCAGCSNGFYGNCKTACGNCVNNAVCDKTTGNCPGGCKAGFQPHLCNTSECHILG